MLALLAGTLAAPGALAQPTTSPPAGGGVARRAGVVGDEPRSTAFASVVPGYRLRFPHDEGSHPEFRLEWWYITGWLNEATRPLGFQITFFRARPELKHDNPSAFTPRQILIAHAALSDPAHGRLIHAQRAAREGFGLAGAEPGRIRVWIDEWRLEQRGTAYYSRIPAGEFQFELVLEPRQPPLLQGESGLSRKGPAPDSASYYYSLPHLRVQGTVTREGKSQSVAGSAWLDHEWSSQYMEKDAVGWDWIGINLEGGVALMAFRMRDQQGRSFWAGGALRRSDGSMRVFGPSDIRFTPRREWRSARTGTAYPVSWSVKAGDLELTVEPLFDDQEHDTRASSGTIYWEGAVRALRDGKLAGLGYLELTGYWRRLNL
ncbi:MAG TPA: lipocalin-like domain-containing protein [Burkholderiales bacterium]|nr:lipocalin-like domain-containing protein [Burkholderiales bacterium]